MRKVRRIVLAAAGMAACAAPAQAAGDVGPLQPTSPWVVDYGQDECFLDRNYGSEKQPLILAFYRVPMDGFVTVSLVTRKDSGRSRTGKAKIAVGAASPNDVTYRAYPVVGSDLRYFKAYVENGVSTIGNAAGTSTISIYAPGEVSHLFSVAGITAALHALDECVLDLGKTWGVPIEQQKRVKEPAKPLQQSIISPDDYPASALDENVSGRAQVRMWVDESGKPLECTPLKSSGSPLFGATTCKLLMRRAAFRPAIDVDGKPVRSIYVFTVDWLVAA